MPADAVCLVWRIVLVVGSVVFGGTPGGGGMGAVVGLAGNGVVIGGIPDGKGMGAVVGLAGSLLGGSVGLATMSSSSSDSSSL